MAFLRLESLVIRRSGQAPDAPKHQRARPIHLSSLYEIRFRPENWFDHVGRKFTRPRPPPDTRFTDFPDLHPRRNHYG